MLERFLGKKRAEEPGVGQQAPDFTLPTPEGGSFTLSEARKSGPVVVAFFKVSCSTCQFTFPFLERLALRYRHDPVSFRGISQDDAEKTQAFCERFGVTFPSAIDAPGYAASHLYHFQYVPTILLIEPNGRVGFRLTGFSKAGLTRLSEEIGRLVGRSPELVFLASDLVPETKPG
jgi:peroxiredoxin